MQQRRVSNSRNRDSNSNSAGGRSRKTKGHRFNIYKATILLCVLITAFYIYRAAGSNSRTTPPDDAHALAGEQSRAIPASTAALDSNQPISPIKGVPETIQLAASLNINSANAVLMELENGTVLLDKNKTAKMYPASMTKIMTAIVALEHIKDLDDKILLNKEIFHSISMANASIAGFLPGEGVSAIDLLYGLILPSGAECAIGLAEYVADSESAFVGLMNEKAHEIGMDGTNFTNATGLHDENLYSTAMDIALLLRYALSNDTFHTIFTTSRHSTQSTNRHEGGITYYSTLSSKPDSLDFEGGVILGGKTGYTEEAGQCLASLALIDDSKYILVTSNATRNYKTQELHIDDAFTVYSAITK